MVDVKKFILFYNEIYYKNNAAVVYLRFLVFILEEVLYYIINLNRGTHVQAG